MIKSEDSGNPQMNINYDQILDTALKGVRRTSAFMALGVNAALDPEFKKYSLTGITQIQLLPEDLDVDAIQEIKSHFLTWVVGCGLRELIETFGVFLDQIFWASSQIAINYDNYNAKEAEKDFREFSDHMGIEGKLKILRSKFNIYPQHSGYIESINKARNCLTHRRGIVGQKDFNEDSSLVINWVGIDIVIITSDGQEVLLDFTSEESIIVDSGEDESVVVLRCVDRGLSYYFGHFVDIHPKFLAEICLFMNREAKEIVRLAVNYARRVGVQVTTPRL